MFGLKFSTKRVAFKFADGVVQEINSPFRKLNHKNKATIQKTTTIAAVMIFECLVSKSLEVNGSHIGKMKETKRGIDANPPKSKTPTK